ncbi:MAG TPA: HEAT repeat domain-containing protein, partial [Planctomycetota bacterium]|nr:HEAT repeat domain-containing protein [Planctomycetota bacterium]
LGMPVFAFERLELRDALVSADGALRRAAVEALGEMGDLESVTTLVAIAGKDRSPEIAAAARAAVARLLTPRRAPAQAEAG